MLRLHPFGRDVKTKEVVQIEEVDRPLSWCILVLNVTGTHEVRLTQEGIKIMSAKYVIKENILDKEIQHSTQNQRSYQNSYGTRFVLSPIKHT